VLGSKRLSNDALDEVDREVLALIESAVQEARSARREWGRGLEDVYVSY